MWKTCSDKQAEADNERVIQKYAKLERNGIFPLAGIAKKTASKAGKKLNVKKNP